MILAMRTDKPIAELHLLNSDGTIKDTYEWEAHLQLAKTLNEKIQTFLKNNSLKLTDINELIVFTGSGSFTGLRIGTTVANTLAYSLDIPIVTGSAEQWLEQGYKKIQQKDTQKYIVPIYDKKPNITKPKAKT